MVLENPLWQQNLEYPARLDRQVIQALLSPGVLQQATHLRVRERAAGTAMEVEIDPGLAVIAGNDQAFQGSYLCRSTAVETLIVPSADDTNDRIDLVVARVRDSNVTGMNDDWIIELIEGTAEPNPEPPPVPNSAIPLAHINVQANANSITDSNIVDLREQSSNPNAAEDPHGNEAHTKTYAEDPHDEESHDSTVARVIAGTYVGDGTNNRVISLPFTPTLVYIAASASTSVQWWIDAHQMVRRAHDGQGSKFTGVTTVENGFKVSGAINQEQSNAITVPYEFVAFGNSA